MAGLIPQLTILLITSSCPPIPVLGEKLSSSGDTAPNNVFGTSSFLIFLFSVFQSLFILRSTLVLFLFPCIATLSYTFDSGREKTEQVLA